MYFFWILTVISIGVTAAVMILVASKAREVPGPRDGKARHRMNPEHLRLMAYALVILICLLATMYELSLMYGE